jgi:hypothetical protein
MRRCGTGSPARIKVCFSELTLTVVSKALIALAKQHLIRPTQAAHDSSLKRQIPLEPVRYIM